MSFRLMTIPFMLGACLFLFSASANSQNPKVTGIELGGKLRVDNGELKKATIAVYQTDGNNEKQMIDVDETGKFDVHLSFQHAYQLVFENNGFYPKTLLINTTVPGKVLKRDAYFPPLKVIVTLFQRIPEIDPSFSEKPVGKIYYSAKLDNFDSESYFNDMQIRRTIDQEVTEAYAMKLDSARAFEENGALADALKEYKRAALLKNGDKSVQDKIARLEEQMLQKTEPISQQENSQGDSVTREPEMPVDSVIPDTLKNRRPANLDSTLIERVAQVTEDSSAQPLTDLRSHTDSATHAKPVITQAGHSSEPDTKQDTLSREETPKTLAYAQPALHEDSAGAQPANASMAKMQVPRSPANVSTATPDGVSRNHRILRVAGFLVIILLILLYLRQRTKKREKSDG